MMCGYNEAARTAVIAILSSLRAVPKAYSCSLPVISISSTAPPVKVTIGQQIVQSGTKAEICGVRHFLTQQEIQDDIHRRPRQQYKYSLQQRLGSAFIRSYPYPGAAEMYAIHLFSE